MFWIILFLAAFLYSSVGHGGASGYLAIMALYHFSPEQMKPIALCMNLFVSLIAFLKFKKEGYFKWHLFWPLSLTSIPFAFIGGSIHVPTDTYKVLLGIVLIIIVCRFLFIQKIPGDLEEQKAPSPILLFTGAIIGFLSGLIGIGGGVLLSPILLLAAWSNQKQTAAISALFIFVNSFAGLLGQLLLQKKLIVFDSNMLLMLAVGIVGSIGGAWTGAKKLNLAAFKYVLSFVLLFAAYHLIWK
jgi:uncharacterized membrane protein YfcA